MIIIHFYEYSFRNTQRGFTKEANKRETHKKSGSKVEGSVKEVCFKAFFECGMSFRGWEKQYNSVAGVIPQSKLYEMVTVEESSLNLDLFTQRHVGDLNPIDNLWLLKGLFMPYPCAT